MPKQDKWDIQKNKRRAEELASFLTLCLSREITPRSPISLKEKELRLINLSPYFGQSESSFGYNLPKNWRMQEKFLIRDLDTSIDSGRIECAVIQILRELDNVAISLPNLPFLASIPSSISDRIIDLSCSSKKTEKLSQLLEDNPEKIFSPVLKKDTSTAEIPVYTSSCVEADKAFEVEAGGMKYSGIYEFGYYLLGGIRGPLIKEIQIMIDGDFILKEGALIDCPAKPRTINSNCRKPKMLQAINRMTFRDDQTNTTYELTVASRSMLLKEEGSPSSYGPQGIKYNPGETRELKKAEEIIEWIKRSNVEA